MRKVANIQQSTIVGRKQVAGGLDGKVKSLEGRIVVYLWELIFIEGEQLGITLTCDIAAQTDGVCSFTRGRTSS
jgi:hypothetical protein